MQVGDRVMVLGDCRIGRVVNLEQYLRLPRRYGNRALVAFKNGTSERIDGNLLAHLPHPQQSVVPANRSQTERGDHP